MDVFDLSDLVLLLPVGTGMGRKKERKTNCSKLTGSATRVVAKVKSVAVGAVGDGEGVVGGKQRVAIPVD